MGYVETILRWLLRYLYGEDSHPTWMTVSAEGPLAKRIENNMKLLTYAINMNPSPSVDVVVRQLKIKQVLPSGQVRLDVVDVPLTAHTVSLEFVWNAEVHLIEHLEDDAGNTAEGGEFKFVARDTIAPALGGVITVGGPTVEREVPDTTDIFGDGNTGGSFSLV